jgi:hypothetical protein
MYLDQRGCILELCAAELAAAVVRWVIRVSTQCLRRRELLRANLALQFGV